MTGDVDSAIELAGVCLDELDVKSERYPGRGVERGRSSASFSMVRQAQSWVKGAPVWQGDERLVKDAEGKLVPALSVTGYLCGVYDDEKGALLVAAASGGNYLAHNVLCWIAARFVAAGCPMPPNLRGYLIAVLDEQAEAAPEGRRGKDPHANHARDFAIANAVYEVVTQDRFRPTRNRASDHELACSIVAQALAQRGMHMGEKAVEKIWGRWAAYMREGD